MALPVPRGLSNLPIARQGTAASDHACGCGPKPRGGGCCSGKDLGPMNDYEAPSQEDIERFSNVTRTCPECRNEVHDDAEICYHCGHVFGGSTPARMPPWVVGVVALIALAMVFWMVF